MNKMNICCKYEFVVFANLSIKYVGSQNINIVIVFHLIEFKILMKSLTNETIHQLFEIF